MCLGTGISTLNAGSPWSSSKKISSIIIATAMSENQEFTDQDRSGLTLLRAQISSDGLVYRRIYPLASLYLLLSPWPSVSTDKSKSWLCKKKIGSVPVGTTTVTDTWVSVGQSGSWFSLRIIHFHAAQRNVWLGELDNTDTSDRAFDVFHFFRRRHKGKICRPTLEKASRFIN